MNANKSDVVKLLTTTEEPISLEEEDAIVTLVVVVIGIIAAIIILFSMGIFLDCKHQKEDSRKKLKLKMPLNSRNKRTAKPEDAKSLATEMCPNGIEFITGDTVV